MKISGGDKPERLGNASANRVQTGRTVIPRPQRTFVGERDQLPTARSLAPRTLRRPGASIGYAFLDHRFSLEPLRARDWLLTPDTRSPAFLPTGRPLEWAPPGVKDGVDYD